MKVLNAPLFRFVLVGGAAFLLDAGTVWALTQFGVGIYWARVVSLGVSVVFTFFWNRTATFLAKGATTWPEFGAYVGASAIGIAINYGLYAGSLKLGLPWLAAMIVGTTVAAAFNFFAYGRIFKASAS